MQSTSCNLLLVLLLVAVADYSNANPARTDLQPVLRLPSDIPTCNQGDQNLNDCIKAALQEMLPRIKNGIPELNIPPLDPFVIEKSNYAYNTGVLQGHISLRNARVHGLSEATVEKVDFELNDGKASMGVVSKLPRMLIEGSYKADMKFNDVKMTPKGFFNVSMTDITLRAHAEGELYERDGHTYLRLTQFDAEPDVGDMHIYATGLLPDPTLNALILDFANQYWRPIYQAMLPETRSTWEPLVLDAINDFFANVPIDLLLTEN